MTKRRRSTARAPNIAAPSIRKLLDAFAAAQPAEQGRSTRSDLGLLEGFLNGYAYESLPGAERALFERHFDAEGAAHREYCEMFGPEKIVPELRMFFGWFMIRKVMARAEDLRRVAEETGRFLRWLGEQKHIAARTAADGVALAEEAATVLPRAEAAAHMFARAVGEGPKPTGDVIEGQFRVARLERGKVWLESWDDGEIYGPLAVPAEVTERLVVDWEVSGAVGRVGRRWVLLEIWNVYPAVG